MKLTDIEGIGPNLCIKLNKLGIDNPLDLVNFIPSEYIDLKKHNQECKRIILKLLYESGLKYGLNGNQEYCVDSTLSLYVEGISSEALMLATKQFCGISNGSACNSNSYKLSYVLEAMGLDVDTIQSTIRISWGGNTVLKELEESFKALLQVAKELV